MIPCAHCGEPVEDDAKRCGHCGSDAETGWNPEVDYFAVELPDGEMEDEGVVEAGVGGRDFGGTTAGVGRRLGGGRFEEKAGGAQSGRNRRWGGLRESWFARPTAVVLIVLMIGGGCMLPAPVVICVLVFVLTLWGVRAARDALEARER